MAERSSRSKTQAAAQAAGLPAGTDSDLVTAWNNRLENDCDLYDTLRISCCFALGELRINQVPRKGGRCKRLICGKACGNIKPWAFASSDECEDYCIACQAIQLVTPGRETADIAVMTKRGPLHNQALKQTILREYTTPISTVKKQFASFVHNGQYSRWPLEILKLAYPDSSEQLTSVDAATMRHHLLLLQHMRPDKASKDAMMQAHADTHKQLSVTDDKRSSEDRNREFRTVMSKMAFAALYDESPLGAVTSRDRAALRKCLLALQANVQATEMIWPWGISQHPCEREVITGRGAGGATGSLHLGRVMQPAQRAATGPLSHTTTTVAGYSKW